MNCLARMLRCRCGQATVEFSLAFFMIALGVFGAIDASRYLFTRHDLSRAAEVIAHEIALGGDASQALVDGRQRSGLGISTATLTNPINGTGSQAGGTWNATTQTCTGLSATTSPSNTCQELSNANVTVVALPGFGTDGTGQTTTDEFQVTVSYQFTPVLGVFLGGKQITMQETVSAITSTGGGG